MWHFMSCRILHFREEFIKKETAGSCRTYIGGKSRKETEMGHLYFARHGQTVNVENKICGATDIELTELGHQQAEELGQVILEQGIQIDEILYSPLIRAKETARHVSEVTGGTRCVKKCAERTELWKIRRYAEKWRRVPEGQG